MHYKLYEKYISKVSLIIHDINGQIINIVHSTSFIAPFNNQVDFVSAITLFMRNNIRESVGILHGLALKIVSAINWNN
jgi:hypothetical protein